ncbi:hypothetical protein [Demequina litorisediminis]|uniref:hypothetical protein n=1 Tax=Demequina litorisediminis TaxID=1849022 RepID=UPI0024E042A1|nr:hypothetical protein [Demequina litorisediminis]
MAQRILSVPALALGGAALMLGGCRLNGERHDLVGDRGGDSLPARRRPRRARLGYRRHRPRR